MTRIIPIEDQVYHMDLSLLVGSRKDLKTYLKSEYGCKLTKKKCATGSSLIEIRHMDAAVIWLRHFSFSPAYVALLAHECLHCATYVLEASGVTLDPAGGYEALAYLQQHVFATCLVALEEGL